MKKFEIGNNEAVVTTKYVTTARMPILYACRESDGEDGESWQFHCGNGDFSPAQLQMVRLGTILELDPSILELADLPVGYCAKRGALGQPWNYEEEAVIEEPVVFLEVVVNAADAAAAGIDSKDEIEDALTAALEQSCLGEVTGGGGGMGVYVVDLEVFEADFAEGLEIVKQALREGQLPASTKIVRHEPERVEYSIYD